MAKSAKDEVQEFMQNLSYGRVATAIVIFIAGGATFYHYVEDFRWLDSVYFTVITLATVGYGDFAPKTDAGKIFTMFYILFGITLFIVLAKLTLASVALRRSRRDGGPKS